MAYAPSASLTESIIKKLKTCQIEENIGVLLSVFIQRASNHSLAVHLHTLQEQGHIFMMIFQDKTSERMKKESVLVIFLLQ